MYETGLLSRGGDAIIAPVGDRSRAAEQEGNMETIIGIALAVIAAALIVGIIRVVSANQPA
jgi:hypothetical protein